MIALLCPADASPDARPDVAAEFLRASGVPFRSVALDHTAGDAIADFAGCVRAALVVADDLGPIVRSAVLSLRARGVATAVLIRSLIGHQVLGVLEMGVAWLGELRDEQSVARALERLGVPLPQTDAAGPMVTCPGLLPRDPGVFARIITRDARLLSLLAQVELVAPTAQTVLITGATGTGKELIARDVHDASGRRGRFVAENVAGLDDALFNDALFGHCRGSFTGATGDRAGLVARAHDGTLFLDEIADLSPAAQTKLLRLIENREFHAIGADTPRTTNARFVVATHRDLEERVRDGLFRRDLYYRLRVHELRVPPLCDRPGDVPLLVDRFAAQAAQELGVPVPIVASGFLRRLRAYSFPGNVRELRAICYHAVATCAGPKLDRLVSGPGIPINAALAAADRSAADQDGVIFPERLPRVDELVTMLIQEAVRRADGNQSAAARMLGLCPSAVSKRMKAAEQAYPNHPVDALLPGLADAGLLAELVCRRAVESCMPFHRDGLFTVTVDGVVAALPDEPESVLLQKANNV